MTVEKRGDEWWYDFGSHKYRGPIPEARTRKRAFLGACQVPELRA